MSQPFREDDREESSLRNLETLAKQIASDPLLAWAGASMGLALGLQLTGHSRAARFVGLWAPTLLLLGLYRRATAQPSHDETRRGDAAEADRRTRFEGGCASPPYEWEETIDDGYRLTAARDVDDYSERISRAAPHKAK